MLRYPGGKTKLAKQIVNIIKAFLQDHNGIVDYREPFAGTAAVGLRAIRECPQLQRAWFNDADPASACLWRAVIDEPMSVKLILGCLEPSVAYFTFYKKLLLGISLPEDLTRYDQASVAAMKLACHAMSFSGLGTRAGGPMGGADQAGDYDVGCRFDAARIAKTIAATREVLSRIDLRPEVCTCLDFEEMMRAPGDAIFYLDPPYYAKGPELYQFSFGHDDHLRLARLLRDEQRPWLLSYDRHSVIMELYGGWAAVEEVPIAYSINGAVRSVELLISNMPLDRTLLGTGLPTERRSRQSRLMPAASF
jgi:DNA adenine methylase